MENFLQIKRTVLESGLDREYKFFQISDMHMACLNENSSELDRIDHARFLKQWNAQKRNFAKEFGEFCDERYDIEPHLIFEMLTKHAVDIKADALILSGDIIDRVTESNLSYMREFVAKYPLPIIYCLGNHGWINENGEHLNQHERFAGIIKNPECDAFDIGEICVVTIDNGEKKITEKQIEFLKSKINENKKILLVVHAPLNIGAFGEAFSKRVSPYFLLGVTGDSPLAFELNRVVEENSDSFIAVLAGHVHCFYEEKINENLTQYTTSSGLIGAGREIIIK